jgi:hypothetical protein
MLKPDSFIAATSILAVTMRNPLGYVASTREAGAATSSSSISGDQDGGFELGFPDCCRPNLAAPGSRGVCREPAHASLADFRAGRGRSVPFSLDGAGYRYRVESVTSEAQ